MWLAKRNLVKVEIAIGIESSVLGFGHEKLAVYPAVTEYISLAFHFCEEMESHRNAKGFDSEGKPLFYQKT